MFDSIDDTEKMLFTKIHEIYYLILDHRMHAMCNPSQKAANPHPLILSKENSKQSLVLLLKTELWDNCLLQTFWQPHKCLISSRILRVFGGICSLKNLSFQHPLMTISLSNKG